MNFRRFATASLVLFGLLTIGAAPDKANVLSDPTFGTLNTPASVWTLQQHGESRSNAVSTKGVATVTVTAKGTDAWNGQFSHVNVSLRKGQVYTLTFTAQGKLDGPLEVLAMKDVEPWNWYGDMQGYELIEQPREFSYRFTAPEDTNQCRIAFQYGLVTGSFELKNVKLTAE